MGALSRAELPVGPHRQLNAALHELHHQAGWPSLRDLAREVGASRTTVAAAFSDPRLPRWGLLELLVEALNGDPDRFHRLWLAASSVPDAAPAYADATPFSPVQPVPAVSALSVPRQLPPDVPAFTGRAESITDVDLVLLPPAGGRSSRIALLSGTAGVGKTALALHWAHRSAPAFPDGQLYADLRGYDPDQPVPPAEVLAEFLRALGVEGTAIAHGVPERTAHLRSVLAGRRTLVLLDNAYSEDQIRPLLPGTDSCAVLVTSRDSLAGLVVRDGAARIDLPLLDPEEGLRLLHTLVGSRVDDEPAAARALGERCAWLPLALRVAAEFAANRPRSTLSALVEEFDAEPALDVLTAGDDEHTAVRSVLSWSYRHLRADVAELFRVLGHHPGPEVSVVAAAALIDGPLTTAGRLLEALARNHLVLRLSGRRYGLHDLLWQYARELAAADPDTAAKQRLVQHYVREATAAARSTETASMPRPTAGPAPPPSVALDWLDTERPVLFALARESVDLSVVLSGVLATFLDTRGHYSDALALHLAAGAASAARGDVRGEAAALDRLGTVRRRLGQYAEALVDHEQAAAAYRQAGDSAGLGRALHNLGVVCWRAGRYREARTHLHEAVTLHRAAGDRSAEGGALYNLGIVYRRLGDYPGALDFHGQALAILREIGDRAGEGRALNNSGVVYLRLGRYAEAVDVLERALRIQRERRDRAGEAVAQVNLGLVCERVGEYDRALEHLGAALELGREIGYRVGVADALRGLGVVQARVGAYAEAAELLRQALDLGREIGEADVETGALNELGEALLADPSGDVEAAAAAHAEALELANASGDRFEQGRALAGLAAVAERTGHPGRARRHRTASRAVQAELGLPT